MYSPSASAGSIRLVILASSPRSSSTTFISSSASGLTLSRARTTPAAPRAASSVFSTLAGCTVSPLTSGAPPAKCSRQPQRVRVVPLHGAVVGHQREPHLVGAFQRGGPARDGAPGMPHHDHDLVQTRRGQVAQR